MADQPNAEYVSTCAHPGWDVDSALPHLGPQTRMDLAALMVHVKYDRQLRRYLRGSVERYEAEAQNDGSGG